MTNKTLRGFLALATVLATAACVSAPVAPFLETHWRQDSPFNDFAPVIEENPPSDDIYLGRAPSGCVATALAQVLRAWEWPYCADEVRTSKHDVSKTSVIFPDETIQLRVDARAPFRWEAMGADGSGDRFETARVLLWLDSIVEMIFANGESGADISDFRRKCEPWFESCENVPKYAADFAEKIVAEIQKGYPVAMMLPGHQVVADGWKREDGIDYVHLNHGWGGKDDGWFPLQGNYVLIQAAQLIRPLRTVQIESLPREVEGEVVLRWHVPKLYAPEIAGFTIVESSDVGTRQFEVSGEQREFVVSDLTIDWGYSYSITPHMANAVASKPVETRCVGKVSARPILSDVGTVSLPLAGGEFAIPGSDIVTLKAWPSHLSYLSDPGVSVEKGVSGDWRIALVPTARMKDRQNVILTLEATSASGEALVKDVAVHFGATDRPVIDLTNFRIVSFCMNGGEPIIETSPSISDLKSAGYGIRIVGAEQLESPLWQESLSDRHRFFKVLLNTQDE